MSVVEFVEKLLRNTLEILPTLELDIERVRDPPEIARTSHGQ